MVLGLKWKIKNIRDQNEIYSHLTIFLLSSSSGVFGFGIQSKLFFLETLHPSHENSNFYKLLKKKLKQNHNSNTHPTVTIVAATPTLLLHHLLSHHHLTPYFSPFLKQFKINKPFSTYLSSLSSSSRLPTNTTTSCQNPSLPNHLHKKNENKTVFQLYCSW